MLRSISWSQFITFILLGIVVYYAYYGWVCQKAGLLRFFFKDRAPGRAGASSMSVASDDPVVAVEAAPESAGGGHAAAGQEKVVKRLETDKNVSTVAPGFATTGKENGDADNGSGDGKETKTDKEQQMAVETKTGKVLEKEADKAAEKTVANEVMVDAAAAGKAATDQTTVDNTSKPAEMEKVVGSANKEAEGKEKAAANMDAEAKALLQTAEMAIMGVKHVVEQAVGSGISLEEIKERLHMVLSGCQALRGTAHVAAVNGFIERNCRASFALVLSEEDLRQLWGGGQTEQAGTRQQEKP